MNKKNWMVGAGGKKWKVVKRRKVGGKEEGKRRKVAASGEYKTGRPVFKVTYTHAMAIGYGNAYTNFACEHR